MSLQVLEPLHGLLIGGQVIVGPHGVAEEFLWGYGILGREWIGEEQDQEEGGEAAHGSPRVSWMDGDDAWQNSQRRRLGREAWYWGL